MKTTATDELSEGKINPYKREIPLIIILLVPLFYTLAIWNTLPEQAPIHFDMEGKADGYGSKWTAAFWSAGFAIPIYILLYFIPRLDPKKKLQHSSKPFYIIRICITILMAAIGCWTLYLSANYGKVNFSMKLIPILISAFMIVMGNYMPTIKQNYFVGIRTPWTLESTEVWTQTHIKGGRAFFYTGIVSLIASIFLPEEVTLVVVVSGITGVAIYSLVYSYRLYQRLKKVA
jgi:uncharacterized membrane protein